MGSTQRGKVRREHLRRLAVTNVRRSTTSQGAEATGSLAHQRLIDLVTQDKVGVILVADLSRLTRSRAQLQALLRLCKTTKTLLAVDGVVLNRLG